MFAQQLVNGLIMGSMFSLIGLSFALLWGILRMLNLAMGEVFMIGAMVALTAGRFDVHWSIALVLAALVGGLVNLVIEQFGFKPFEADNLLVPLLASLAFAMFLRSLATNVWTSDYVQFPYALEVSSYDFGLFSMTSAQLIIVCTSLAVMLLLEYLVYQTSMGRAMRAIAGDRDVASLLGVQSRRVVRWTFFLSGAVAGIAGIQAGFAYGQVSPYIGVQFGFYGLTAAIIGGLSKLRGVMLGGLVVGVTHTMSVAYISSSHVDLIVFGLVFVVLFFRPEGLIPTRR